MEGIGIYNYFLLETGSLDLNKKFYDYCYLQVFEPPLDMSQDMDSCEHQNLKNVQDHHLNSDERENCACHSVSTSGQVSLLKSDEASCGEGSNLTCRSPNLVYVNQV